MAGKQPNGEGSVESMWMHDGRLERQRREGEGKSAEQQSSSASKEGVNDVVSTVDFSIIPGAG